MTDIRPKADFICNRCDKEFVNETYACDRDNHKICDDCSYAWELDDLESHAKSVLYGPSKLFVGAKVTNWPGKALGTIIHIGGLHHWTKRSFYGERYYCKIRTANNCIVGGYIGEGLASNVKLLKGLEL